MIKQAQQPEVLRHNFISMQLCVPKEWSEEEILRFAREQCPVRWEIVTDGPDPTYVSCPEKSEHKHVVLCMMVFRLAKEVIQRGMEE